MPIDFSVGECIALARFGTFLSARAGGKIPAGVKEPVIIRLPVPLGHKVITGRFNFGGTSIGVERPKVKYEIHYEGGLYCWNHISQANLENVCTHLYCAEWAEVHFFNITDPPEDVYYDICIWYYFYSEVNEKYIIDLFFRTPEIRKKIHEEVEMRDCK